MTSQTSAVITALTAAMTLSDCYDYVDEAGQAEGEMFAEWGMGATSMGYNAAEWAPDYSGYRVANDPVYAEAKARCDAAGAARMAAATPADDSASAYSDDDIPF